MSDTIFPRTNKTKDKSGWTLQYSFLDSVLEDCNIYEGSFHLEEIEAILLSETVQKEVGKHLDKLNKARKMVDELCSEYACKIDFWKTNYGQKILELKEVLK